MAKSLEKNTLYIEAFSGLAGDMLLSAFCGLADYYDQIIDLPQRLNLGDGKVEIKVLNKNGIVCKHVHIIDQADSNKHTSHHDHGETDHHHHHDHHHQNEDHDHHHEDHHQHHEDHHHHPDRKPEHHHHRHLKDILEIIDRGDITDKAKEIAKAIFMIIGESEAKIHNMELSTIHFHEVSAVDSILDIVGCSVLIDLLQIEKTYCTPVCTGFGMVKTQHGLLPVPAPATADILRHMPIYPGKEEGERVTPTGAAVLKYLNPDFEIAEICQQKIAYGPGQKDFIAPNVVRVSLLDAKKKAQPILL